MGVKPDPAHRHPEAPALSHPLVSRFAVTGEFLDAVPYGSGHIHDTLLARFAADGSETGVIFQRLNDRVFRDPPKVMENIARVTAHLHARLAAIPGADPDRDALRLVPTRDGRTFAIDDEGRCWRAFRFIDRTRTFEVCKNPLQAAEAGRVVARFQELLSDLPAPRLHDTIPFFHDTPRRLDHLEAAVADDVAGRCAAVEAEIAFARDRRGDMSAVAELVRRGEIPERVTHNDTKLNNILFDESTGRGLCLTDLDTCMAGSALYDFGDMVRTMTSTAAEDEADASKVGLDLALFEGLTRGYLEIARAFLTPREIEWLAFSGRLLTFTVGVRFLTDYLSGDVYFKIHRPGHNLDRCRNQFRLVESMERQDSAMRSAVRSVLERGAGSLDSARSIP